MIASPAGALSGMLSHAWGR